LSLLHWSWYHCKCDVFLEFLVFIDSFLVDLVISLYCTVLSVLYCLYCMHLLYCTLLYCTHSDELDCGSMELLGPLDLLPPPRGPGGAQETPSEAPPPSPIPTSLPVRPPPPPDVAPAAALSTDEPPPPPPLPPPPALIHCAAHVPQKIRQLPPELQLGENVRKGRVPC